jgi:hypothetical protein
LRALVSAVSRAETVGFGKQIHWFCSTIPLISFNDFNGFVQQYQWICSFYLASLLRLLGVFVSFIWRFYFWRFMIGKWGTYELQEIREAAVPLRTLSLLGGSAGVKGSS